MTVIERTRGAVNVVLPGKLYQRGNMLKWPLAQKEKMFQELGITAVVNVWSKVDPDQSHPSRIYINYPVTSKRPHGPTATSMARLVAALIRSGHVVLVHCEAGRNRSVWFCIRVLVALGGVGVTEAYEAVLAAVPSAALRPELREDLGDI
jgi:hypothetical protein